MSKINISVTILTKNSQKYIEEVLNALVDFSEVLVYDTGSTDITMEIALKYPNATLYQRPFEGFGPSHNQASNLAKYDWILSVDSDEVVTSDLVDEIRNLNLDKRSVYSMPRDNYYNGKWIKWCGWYPDRQIRLYNRTETSFSNVQVHESIIKGNLNEIKLKSSLRHYSYANVSDFLTKMQSYSELFAKQNCGRKSSSMFKAISHGFFAFFKSYFLKKGFLGGREGFEISIYNGNTAFYKYLKLLEMNQYKYAEKCGDDQKRKEAPSTFQERSIHIPQQKKSCCKKKE